jgi:hypothetical protein
MASVRIALRISRGDNLAPDRFEDDWGVLDQIKLLNRVSYDDQTRAQSVPTELKSLTKSGLKIATEPLGPRRSSIMAGSAPKVKLESKKPTMSTLGWVQCDHCDSWREIPQYSIDAGLPDKWYCSMVGIQCSVVACAASTMVSRETQPSPSELG